jgi:glycosyltransferase involved in cell wall biosynthesis
MRHAMPAWWSFLHNGQDLLQLEHTDRIWDMPESVYIESPLAQEIARSLSAGIPLSVAFWTAVRKLAARCVHYAALDVNYDSRLRILQLVTTLQRGGAERIALDLTTELNHSPLCTSHFARLAVLGSAARETFPIPTETLDLATPKTDRHTRLTRLHTTSLETGIDLIHGHLIDPEDMRAIRAHDWPLMVTVHNQRPGWPIGFHAAALPEKIMLAACAQAVETDLEQSGIKCPIRTVWNGIDCSAFQRTPALVAAAARWRAELGLTASDYVMLALANPRPQKRLELLPAILAATQADFSRRGITRCPKLILCGERERVNAQAKACIQLIQDQIQTHQLTNDCIWLGSISEINCVLAASDLLISTSAYEGLSLAQLEALAVGLPIVATAVGGIREINADANSIRLVAHDANPETFAAQIAECAQNLGCRDSTTVRKYFSRSVMTARYAGLYPTTIAFSQPRKNHGGICLITNNFSMGGAQSSARRLLLGLQAKGIPVRAMVLQEQSEFPTPGRSLLQTAGVSVRALPPSSSLEPAEAVQLILADLYRQPPAAVVCWNALMSYKVLLADSLLGIRMFDVSPGEMYFASLMEYFSKARAGFPYRHPKDYGRRLAGVVVKYHAEKKLAEETLGIPAHVIPNGIELSKQPAEQRYPISKNAPFVIGTAARISPQKKLEELLSALRSIQKCLPPFVLRIAGGVERGSEDYAHHLRRLGTGLPVEWMGEVAPISEFLQSLDLFAMISEPAGCPNASLEALATGLPVVATDHGGISEQIISQETGWLVPRGDKHALGAAILELSTNDALRAKIAQHGREHVAQHFNLDIMIERYCKLFLPTLSNNIDT